MSSSPTETRTVDITMPQMGVSVAEGTVIAWKVDVGDPVAADETVCEISSDKIDAEVPAPASGVLTEIVAEAGDTVDVGAVLGRISTAAPGGDGPAAPPRHYSPVVQRIAREHGIDLAKVPGTGRDGRVRKQDVLAYVERQRAGAGAEPPPAEAPAEAPLHIESPYIPEPAPAARPAPAAEPAAAGRAAPATADGGGTLSHMRRQIGAHMKRSLETAATCTTWMDADMGRVEAWRRTARAGGRTGMTALPIVARCVIEALAEHPTLNATLEGDRFTVHEDVNLGIAVSLGEDGLIVPVIERAQELSVEGLAVRIRELAARARARELTPDEVRGGTFTITNPGQYGAIMATPVINQPQVAILDLEAIVKRPVVVEGPDGGDLLAIRPQTILGLSWDHRALDGALAAQFLAAVRRRLEQWDG